MNVPEDLRTFYQCAQKEKGAYQIGSISFYNSILIRLIERIAFLEQEREDLLGCYRAAHFDDENCRFVDGGDKRCHICQKVDAILPPLEPYEVLTLKARSVNMTKLEGEK